MQPRIAIDWINENRSKIQQKAHGEWKKYGCKWNLHRNLIKCYCLVKYSNVFGNRLMKCFYIHYFATDNAKRNKIECKELVNDISSVSVVVILFFFDTIYIFDYMKHWLESFAIHFHDFFHHWDQYTVSFNWCSIFTNIQKMLVYWFCLSIAHQSLLACFDLANFQLNLFFLVQSVPL